VSIEPKIHQSAYKHGISRDDILHVYRNYTHVHRLDDDTVALFGAGQSNNILEIIMVVTDEEDFIIHAMRMRKKFWSIYA